MKIRKISILRRLSIVCLLLCANLLVWAQGPVYTCDFEDEAERAEWKLNIVAKQSVLDNLENKWWMDESGNFSPTGSHGLYISSATNGNDAVYEACTTMFTVAVREIDLPDLPDGKYSQEYNLYFDWKCSGKASSGEGLYVCWMPRTEKTNSSDNAAGVPAYCTEHKVGLPNIQDSLYARKRQWGPGKAVIEYRGVPSKLVFVWFSAKGRTFQPSACIDNIELRPVEDVCQAPTNVTHFITGDSIILSWKGNADHYSVKFYDRVADRWFVEDNITARSCTIPHVGEGMQSFFVRAYCDKEGVTASDFVEYTTFMFHKGVYCIDYMDLTDDNCYTGVFGDIKDQFQNKGKIDRGYYDWTSRHTLHYEPDEYDEHTNYKLKTCPPGYLTSVRLGDNTIGGLGEGIKYEYNVGDGARAIMKIKYAMVLQQPETHTYEQMPKFRLEVLCDGKPIANKCGTALFQAGEGGYDAGWRPGAEGWVYKNWEEHSVNLRDYVGKKLTIRLSTADCTPKGHTGYVYFVLDCESGDIEGLNCGKDNPTTRFTAPSGFDYAWYLSDNIEEILSTEQTLEVDPFDTREYSVNVITKNNANCWYTLSACGLPRVPTPLATYEAKTIRCENVVTFNNLSYVSRQTESGGPLIRTDEPVSFLEWDFGDGVVLQSLDTVIKHTYPKKGGRYVMRLRAGINDGFCTMEDSIILQLPNLTPDTTMIDEHLCRDEYPFGYMYAGQAYTEDLDSIFTFISKVSGCDSLCHVRLKYHEKGPFVQTDTICYGDSVLFVDRWIKESGRYDTLLHNPWGCDSIVRLDLFVDPLLKVRIPDTIQICPEDPQLIIPYMVEQGRLDSLTILFDSASISAGFEPLYSFRNGDEIYIAVPDALSPNRYWAKLSYQTPLCVAAERPICIELGYSASVIWQKSDLLAITNEDYNGGYEFLTYQWYRDGEPVEGATGPNLSVTDADRGHEFYVVVQRQDDGVKLGTCSVVYMGTTGIDNINLSTLKYPISVYTLMGIRMTQINNISEMNMLPQGMYILTDGETTIKWVR